MKGGLSINGEVMVSTSMDLGSGGGGGDGDGLRVCGEGGEGGGDMHSHG